jgi:hypothetical protein
MIDSLISLRGDLRETGLRPPHSGENAGIAAHFGEFLTEHRAASSSRIPPVVPASLTRFSSVEATWSHSFKWSG